MTMGNGSHENSGFQWEGYSGVILNAATQEANSTGKIPSPNSNSIQNRQNTLRMPDLGPPTYGSIVTLKVMTG